MKWSQAVLIVGCALGAFGCSPSRTVDFTIEIEGLGTVTGAGTSCSDPTCLFRVRPPVELTTASPNGWQFAGWRGDCQGTGSCVVRSTGFATARFIKTPVLRVTVLGGGRIEASDGHSCSDVCEWQPSKPVLLTAFSSGLFELESFSGACEGRGPCLVESGAVTATFTRARKHSLSAAAIWQDSTIGYARVVTDYATSALLCDVFVLPEYQGQGVGKALVRACVEHDQLCDCRWMLGTRDAHTLYEQFGFQRIATDPTRLERTMFRWPRSPRAK